MHTNLTLEERERFAYIEGRTGETVLLALAIDGESDALDEMRHERDSFKDDSDRLESDNTNLQEDVDRLEDKVVALQQERDELDGRVLEMRAQIEAAGVDLI